MESDLTTIIGISCLLPEAQNTEQYWSNLLINRNCIKAIPKERFYTNQFKNQLDSIHCIEGGFIVDIATFDRQFFGISPNEAKQMDPQHRLALQEAWHCVEDANIDIALLQKQRTGVFAAQMSSDYLQLSIDSSIPIDQFTCLGNYESSLANRISHHLKLSGPSITMNTACAGSLVAIHQARQSLLTGECDYALVISANIICHPLKHLSFSMAGMLSRTGQCHTFAANADGYVPGEGIVAVLLCRSHFAEKHHHRIYGTILNSGVNHNAGAQSISSPSLDKQAELLQNMYRNITLKHLDYIELHGTGTSLGDPIEYQALQKALGERLEKICFLGSVKTAIGHLEASAGLAGLLKVVLMLTHETIVPSFDIQTPNPLIDLGEQPFQLCTSKNPWPAGTNRPRIAGISSMGFSGVNAHLIVSDQGISKHCSSLITQTQQGIAIPLLISLKSEATINETKDHWLSFLISTESNAPELCLASLNRSSFDYRFAFLATKPSKEELAEALSQGSFIKKQELPYLIFDAIDFVIPKEQQKNISSFAKAKMQAIENPSLKISIEQKTTLTTQIYLFDLLNQAKVRYRTLICSENAPLGILFYLDCISSLEAIKAHLNEGLALCLSYTNLTIPLIIGSRPFIDEEYLKDLFQVFMPKRKELETFLSKADILFQHQYTFKGLVTRWQHQLKKYEIDLFEEWRSLRETLQDPLNDYFINPTEFIVLIALISSLEKLRKLWGLTYCIHDKVINEQLQDLSYLVLNNILDEDDVVCGVRGGHVDFNRLINNIYLKLSNLEGLPFLRKQRVSISYKKEWDSCCFFANYAQNNVIYIGNNNGTSPPKPWSMITAGDLEEKIIQTLINQWLNGQNIHWSSVFPDKQKAVVDLPKYLFNLREKFWHC